MSKKLTMKTLKKIISEEKSKMLKGKIISTDSVETVEDAWSGGDNLVNHVNFLKKLGITEMKLRKKANDIAKARKAIKSRILKDI